MRGPKAPYGAALEVLLYRRACEAHHHGVGQRLGHAPTENAVLRAVSLVHHDDDVLRGVEHVKLAFRGRQRLLEFLDGGHHRAAAALLEDALQVERVALVGPLPPTARPAFGRFRARPVHPLRGREAAALEGACDLPVQLPAVGDHDDGGIAQARLAAQLRRQPQHGQRLARSLRVPDHAAPLLRLPAR